MVIWSEPAKADLRSINDFIAHDSRHYAKKASQDIREKTAVLDELPKFGKKVPELNDDAVR
ncbi:MAG: toxin ParE1/3/4 [Gammaproteobacteria bacterium]|jgi:toxin ParE1/3/4